MLGLWDVLVELWADLAFECFWALQRLRRNPFVTDRRPATRVSNLLMLGIIHSVAERLPCEVTVRQDNIFDFALNWADDDGMTRARGDAWGSWASFSGARRNTQCGLPRTSVRSSTRY